MKHKLTDSAEGFRRFSSTDAFAIAWLTPACRRQGINFGCKSLIGPARAGFGQTFAIAMPSQMLYRKCYSHVIVISSTSLY